MISPQLKRILESINFANKFLTIRSQFCNSDIRRENFGKKEILQIFSELGVNVQYLSGGGYLIKRMFENYTFECNFIISRTNNQIFYYLNKDGQSLEKESNVGMFFHDLHYDEGLNNPNFSLNTILDYKIYIKSMIQLFNLAIDTYIYYLEEL